MDLTVNVILEDDFPLQPLDSIDSGHASRTETLEQGEEDEEDEEPLITRDDEALITIPAVNDSPVQDSSPVDDSPLDTGRGSVSTTIKKAAASMTKSQWKRIFTAVATLIAYMFLTAGISMIAPFYPIVVSCIRNVPSPPPTPNPMHPNQIQWNLSNTDILVTKTIILIGYPYCRRRVCKVETKSIVFLFQRYIL